MSNSYANFILDSKKDVTLAAFAWKCAETFVFSHDGERIGYLEGELAKAEEELAKANARSLADWKREHALFYERIKGEVAASEKNKAEKRAKLEAMRKKVAAWKPPAKKHFEELQDFMDNQLAIALRDCHAFEIPMERDSVSWAESRLELLRREIFWHKERIEQARQRMAERKRWLDELAACIGDPPGDFRDADR